MASPMRIDFQKKKEFQKKPDDTYQNLEMCWKVDLDWSLYPECIEKGCKQIGKALSVAPSAVLGGIIILVSFFISHSEIHVENTAWIEPAIVWLSVGMPSGSGKSPVFKYLMKVIQQVRKFVAIPENAPSWHLDVATFEKMGALMDDNNGKLLGIYDELTTFLTQINLYKSRGHADSHDVAVFLQLYNGNPWARKTVTGEANFNMERTSLVVGGFTQPVVARQMIEQPGSTEKGIAQRFLWLFPKPVFEDFGTLEPIDNDFTERLIKLLAAQLSSDKSCRIWHLKTSNEILQADQNLEEANGSRCQDFITKYNVIQKQLQDVCGRDDLVSGFLSKAKGQLLRVATCLHVLFNIDSPNEVDEIIGEIPIKAGINFIEVCCQHAFSITGRHSASQQTEETVDDARAEDMKSNAQYTILLPGKALHLTPLNNARKFRNRGNKEGGYKAFKYLAHLNLGRIEEYMVPGQKVKHYTFWKKPVPDNEEDLSKFRDALMEIEVAIRLYKEAFEKADICNPSTPKKRGLED